MILRADARRIPLRDESVQCVVTSPPYFGLRDYQTPGQLGLEPTPEEYVSSMVEVFREVRRVLRKDGTVWLNLGDSYARAGGWSDNSGLDALPRGKSGRARTNAPEGAASQKLAPGLKEKDLCGIPWRVAFALQADGWYLRSDIIWSKPNPMPESVTDRPTKAHEYVFLLSKSARYYYDAGAIKEPSQTDPKENYPARARVTGRGNQSYPGNQQDKSGGYPMNGNGRNRRSVWEVPTAPYSGSHFATFPPKLIEPMILAGCPKGGIVLDPFVGSGTTVMVARDLGRVGIGMDIAYHHLSTKRIYGPLFAETINA